MTRRRELGFGPPPGCAWAMVALLTVSAFWLPHLYGRGKRAELHECAAALDRALTANLSGTCPLTGEPFERTTTDVGALRTMEIRCAAHGQHPKHETLYATRDMQSGHIAPATAMNPEPWTLAAILMGWSFSSLAAVGFVVVASNMLRR